MTTSGSVQSMLNSSKAKQRPVCGMLSVKVATVKGTEYELHMNHFYDYHCECSAEFLGFPALECSFKALSNHTLSPLQASGLPATFSIPSFLQLTKELASVCCMSTTTCK